MKNNTEIPLLDGLGAGGLEQARDILKQDGLRLSIDKLPWPKDYPYCPLSEVYLGHDKESLYLLFHTVVDDARAEAKQDGEDVYTDCCVEAFIAVEDSPYYYNFEFNPKGICQVSKRKSRQEASPFQEKDYKKIERYVPEIVEKDSLGDTELELCVRIPFELMDALGTPAYIRANFYKCGDATKTVHYCAWNPPLTESPDFHRPESFLPLDLCL